jgi:hypothetical protein
MGSPTEARAGRGRWEDLEPSRRTRWAMAVAVEALVVAGAAGWFLSRLTDEPAAAWSCAALFAVWCLGWLGCLALRPALARRWAVISGAVVLALAALVGTLLLP